MLMDKTTQINPIDPDVSRHSPKVKRPGRARSISGKSTGRELSAQNLKVWLGLAREIGCSMLPKLQSFSFTNQRTSQLPGERKGSVRCAPFVIGFTEG